MTAMQIALWALIVSAATLLVYLGQLLVLILVYLRVIKETDRNARERQQAIEHIGETMQAKVKVVERDLNGIAKRNTISFSIMGAGIAVMMLIARAALRKVERMTNHDE